MYELMFDVEKIRLDFPILAKEIFGNPLVYLDNANCVGFYLMM